MTPKQKIADLQAQIDKLKAEIDKGDGLNARGGKYFNIRGNHVSRNTHQSDFDEAMHQQGNYFLKESQAQSLLDWRKKYGQALRVYIELSDGEPECDWSDVGKLNYYPYFSNVENTWAVGRLCSAYGLFEPLFANKETCQRFVDWLNDNMGEG